MLAAAEGDAIKAQTLLDELKECEASLLLTSNANPICCFFSLLLLLSAGCCCFSCLLLESCLASAAAHCASLTPFRKYSEFRIPRRMRYVASSICKTLWRRSYPALIVKALDEDAGFQAAAWRGWSSTARSRQTWHQSGAPW